MFIKSGIVMTSFLYLPGDDRNILNIFVGGKMVYGKVPQPDKSDNHRNMCRIFTEA